MDWKAAVEEATKSIEALDRLESSPPGKAEDKEDTNNEVGAGKVSAAEGTTNDDDGIIELADEDKDEAAALKKIQDNDKRKEDIKRIRAKALMRRARARSEQGGWGNLQGALEGIISHNP